MRVKWGLHPISAGAAQDETIGEASYRQRVLSPRLPHKNLGLGLPPGRSKGRPGFCFAGAILSEVMASGADLIRNIKQQIQEIDPKDVQELRQNGNGAVIVVDVREQHEFEESHL